MSQSTLEGRDIRRLTPEERAKAFSQKFPNYAPLVVHNGGLYTTWVVGAAYYNGADLYGQYPHHVLERILALFPDCRRVAHIFSGTLQAEPGSLTYDVNPMYHPTICDDIANLTRHTEAFKGIQLAVCDPPYDADDYAKYGVKPFNKAQVLRDLAVVLPEGCFLAWLDTKVPMYRKAEWELLGHIGLVVSTNHRARMWSLWERTPKVLIPEGGKK